MTEKRFRRKIMEKFTPYAKLSKKKKRELDKRARGSWGGLNPVTRKPEPSKAYNRRKARKWDRDDDPISGAFLLSIAGTV